MYRGGNRRLPPRKLPQGVSVVERPGSGENTFKRSMRSGERKMRDYDVLLDGAVIGRVFQDLATFERKTKGRTYVNSRWRNIRWFYEFQGHVTYWQDRTTRIDVVELLLGAYQSHQRSAQASGEEARSGPPEAASGIPA